MRFASVCSGIEAASVAWLPLGWECAWVSETAPFPSAVLAHHYASVENLGDFTKIGPDRGPIDLLVGGTPCQSFSVAGRRAGLDDPRGALAFEFIRLAGRLRPRWVVFENVPGLLSSDGGRDFGAFLGALGAVGYGFAYRVLDAQYFGLAQRRERVFVVGCLGDWRRAAAVLFEPSGLRGDPAPSRETGARVAGCLDGGAHGGGSDDNDAQGRRLVCHEVAPTLNHGGGMGQVGFNGCDEMIVAHSLRATGFDASEDGTGRGTPIVVNMQGSKSSALASDDGTCPTLNAMHGHDVHAVAFIVNAAGSCAKESHAREAEVARCLDGTGGFASAQGGTVVRGGSQQDEFVPMGGIVGALAHSSNAHGGHHQPKALGPYGVRRLTPRECERLQGFPDDYTLVPYRGKLAKDGPRYQALGNSMAVPVMAWIGRRIALVDALAAPRARGE